MFSPIKVGNFFQNQKMNKNEQSDGDERPEIKTKTKVEITKK